jgi:hypothetical protein
LTIVTSRLFVIVVNNVPKVLLLYEHIQNVYEENALTPQQLSGNSG